MSPHEQRFGHEFLGLLLPLGAKVSFRPPTPVLKAQHKLAPRTRAGVFLGWHMLTGGRWSGDYLVGDLEDFEAGSKNLLIYQIKELVQPEVIEFPLKDIYKHVELISPEETEVQADIESDQTKSSDDHTRPYRGSSRPKHIPSKVWMGMQYAERLKIVAQERAKALKEIEDRSAP